MKQISTACARDCYDTCSLIVTVADSGEILSIRGNPEHSVTQGFACPRGVRDHERLYKNRVEEPYLRKGDNAEPASWKKAMDAVSLRLGEVLDRFGPESVLYLDYAGNMGLLSSAFPRRLWNAIGATRTDGALCSTSGHKALSIHYGESYGVNPIEILSLDLVVFWGFNAAVSAPHIWSLAIKARKERGTRIVVVDPIESLTARGADLWIQPMPGSDVALAYGVINYLIQNEHIDQEFIKEWTQGFDRLKAIAGEWTPDRVEKITGVDWDYVEQLGIAYGSLRQSTTMIGIGLQKNDQGADQVRAVSFIPAVLGLHRGYFYSTGGSFSVDGSLITGKSLTDKTQKIVEQVALADLVKKGEFKFVYVSGMNPAMTLPNQSAFREGLSRQDVFVAVHETHWTKTTEYADVVLPAPTYLEKEDLVIPWGHNQLRCSKRVIDPVTDSRSEVSIMREIAERLDLKEEWLYEDPWSALEPAFEGAIEEDDFQSLRSGGMVALRTKPKDHYSTPSGKIEFDSSIAADAGLNTMPMQAPLCFEEGKYILLSSATPQFTSTQFQEVYGPIPAVVMMNSSDAGSLGIEEDNIVTIANDLGEVQVKVIISGKIPESVLWSPRQSEGLNGEPLNCLMSSRPQEIGRGPRFNSTRVTVRKQ
jgi:anaerobic selenocysteine-containing dehydrogenase